MSVTLSSDAHDYANEAGEWVRDVVRRHRRAGAKLEAAFDGAARDLGMSARRARSFWYRQPVALLTNEYFDLRERMHRHLHREAARLEAESKLLDARRALIGRDA